MGEWGHRGGDNRDALGGRQQGSESLAFVWISSLVSSSELWRYIFGRMGVGGGRLGTNWLSRCMRVSFLPKNMEGKHFVAGRGQGCRSGD